MDNNIKELLEDCKDTMNGIVGCEFWEYMKESSSCEDLITKIDNVLNREVK